MWGGGTEYGTRFARCHFRAQKNLDFQGPSLPMALVMDVARIKIIMSRSIEETDTLTVIADPSSVHFPL
jgi:hypothetical protein